MGRNTRSACIIAFLWLLGYDNAGGLLWVAGRRGARLELAWIPGGGLMAVDGIY
jgi:hypothetical protein